MTYSSNPDKDWRRLSSISSVSYVAIFYVATSKNGCEGDTIYLFSREKSLKIRMAPENAVAWQGNSMGAASCPLHGFIAGFLTSACKLTIFLYPRPNRACPCSRKLLPRSQFAKLKVDTFIFYLNAECEIRYDWKFSPSAWSLVHSGVVLKTNINELLQL